MNHFNNLVKKLESQFPDFKVKAKERSTFCRFLNIFIKIWNKTWMSDFTMTIRHTVFMPQNLIGTDEGYRVLRHEAVHVKDFSWWFAVSYPFLFPSVLTMRAYWELRGYTETMRVHYEDFHEIPDELIDFITNQFVSSNYLWMFPFKTIIKNKLLKIRNQILAKPNL